MNEQKCLNSQENHAILPGVIQVNRTDIRRRHDLLMAEIKQLREWLGYRPIETRERQQKLESTRGIER